MTRRLMPFLFLLYIVNYIDRNNVGFAGLQMTGELRFSDAVFGLGSGIFFIGYVLLGIPGAMIVEKWSARKIMAGTMIAWGCVASATGLIHTEMQFYVMRFSLGVAEAAFFPGIITYIGHWHRATDRAKAVAMFMAAIPVSQVIAAPLSAALMRVHWLDLAGWRWLLILEGAPAVLCGFLIWMFLTDRPWQAKWLAPEERDWLTEELRLESSRKQPATRMPLLTVMRHRDIWLLCLAYFGGTTGNYGVNLWMPKMLQKLGSLSASETSLLAASIGLISSLGNLGGFAGPYAIGWLSTQTGSYMGGLLAVAAALFLSGVVVVLVRARGGSATHES